MAFSVVMPALEMAQETGKLLAWRKKEGDSVSKGEPLLEIETDKAVVEVEAPADGLLAGIKASEGAEIPVGQIIAWIVAPGEQLPIEPETAAPAAQVGLPARARPADATPVAVPVSQHSGTVKISPKARRLAKELGVDVSNLTGSGPEGEILASDVQAAHGATTSPRSSPSPEASVQSAGLAQVEVPSTLGRIMADRTTQSWTTVPHFFVTRDVDAGHLNLYRDDVVKEIESKHGVRVSHSDLLVALTARVLIKHPRLNASWINDGIHLHDYIHMGIAIAVTDGVVAGVIRNSHTASLSEIAIARRAVTERARAGKLRLEDISDATFTISNLGMYKVDQFNAILSPPQAAILAVGAISDRVVAIEGKPIVRPMLTLTISCDHRVVDGARAAMFLGDLAGAISRPASVLNLS